MLKKLDYNKLLFVYKIYMIVYLLCSFNAFVNGQKFMKYATVVAAASGGILLLCLLAQWKKYRKMGNLVLLILFLVSYVFSSVMNIRYGFMENIQELVWLTCQIGLLYVASYNYTTDMLKREFGILGVIYTSICTLFSLISLSMIFWMFDGAYRDPSGGLHGVGYRLGRLWGVYDDPNHGSVIAVIAIFFALYLYKLYHKKMWRVLLIISIIVQYLYIGFANSRTAMLALGGGLCVGTFLLFYNKQRRFWAAAGVSVLIMTVSVVGLIGMEVANGKTFAAVQIYYTEQKAGEKDAEKPVVNQRKEELTRDESNGRKDIWLSGLEIARTSPIYGTSFRNMTPYAENKLPETFIVNNNVVKYDSLHNLFVDVLVSQGVIGLLITAALIVNTLRMLLRGMRRVKKEDYDIMIISFVMVVAMLIASMFYSYVFYLHAPQTYIFWLCLGYMVVILQRACTEREEIQE